MPDCDPIPNPPPWTLFRWGSRGCWYTTGEPGIYMAHIFIPGGMRVMLEATQATDEQVFNTFHVKADHPTIVYADCLAVANAFNGWWNNYYRHMVNTSYIGRQVTVTGTDAVPAAQAAVRLTTSGDRSGDPMPDNVSFSVKAVTHLAGRRYRGRMFAFTPVRQDLEPGTPDRLSTGYSGALVNVLNSLLTIVASAGYTLAVASYRGAFLTPIASWINSDDAVDDMGRRLAGRG